MVFTEQERKERHRIADKKYKDANKEKVVEYHKQHYVDNKDKIAEQQKQYREDNHKTNTIKQWKKQTFTSR